MQSADRPSCFAKRKEHARVSKFVSTTAVTSDQRVGTFLAMPDVVLPVLDEAQALPQVLARIPHGYDPIVVDNGSSDGSASIAAQLGARVVAEPRRGFGAACFTGLQAATADVVCFMDCDGSLDPRRPRAGRRPGAPRRRRSRARRPPSLRSERGPRHARVANRVLARDLRRRTGIALTDLGPMRAARRGRLLELDLVDRRFGWPLEMVLRAGGRGLARGRGARALAAHRALEGHRNAPRNAACNPRHGNGAAMTRTIAVLAANRRSPAR